MSLLYTYLGECRRPGVRGRGRGGRDDGLEEADHAVREAEEEGTEELAERVQRRLRGRACLLYASWVRQGGRSVHLLMRR